MDTIKLFSSLGDAQATALAMGALGLVYLNLGQLDEALAYTLKAYEEFERELLVPNGAIVRNNLASIYLAMGRGDLAISYAGMGRSIAGQSGMPQLEASANMTVAEIYEKNGDAAQAETFYKVAIDIAERSLAFGPLEKSHQKLAALYRGQGRLSEALDHLEDAIKARNRQHEFEISAFRGHFDTLRQRLDQPRLEV
jgi:tetratricopeptide (TPR) repeat protein